MQAVEIKNNKRKIGRIKEASPANKKMKSKNAAERSLDGVLNLSLFMIIFGIPLFFTGLAFQGMFFEKEIYFYFWILIALISWVSKGIKSGKLTIKRTFMDVPILLFLVFYLISASFSLDRWHSFIGAFGDPSRGVISIIGLAVLYFMVVSNFSKKIFAWMIGGFMVSSAIVFIQAILAFFNVNILPAKFAVHIPFTLIGSMDSLGILAGLAVPIILMVVLKLQSETKDGIGKNILTGLLLMFLAFVLFLLFAIYSYVAWPAILIGTGVFLIYILARVVNLKDSWSWLPMLTFVSVVVFLMVGSVRITKADLPVSVNIPFKASLEIAKKSLQDRTLTGYGPANYGYAYSKNLPDGFDSMGLRLFQGQGILFESISTLGIIGTILLTIMILTFFGAGFFLLSKKGENNKIYSLGMMAAILIFFVDAILLKVEAPVLILGTMLIASAVAMLNLENGVKENSINLSLKASPKYALTLGFIFLLVMVGVAYAFVFIGKLYFADINMRKAAMLEKSISEDGSIASAVRAINLNKREGRYHTRLGQEYMLLANREATKENEDINKIQTYLSSALEASKKGVNLMGSDVTAVESLAQVYENVGSYIPDTLNAANDEYKVAVSLEPQNPDFLVKLGQISIKIAGTRKDDSEKKPFIESARDLFQKSISIRRNYAPGYYNMALAEEALGQLDNAVSNMEKAVSFGKSNADYVFNLARLYQKRGGDTDNKNAEILFNKILAADPNSINTHFSLGLLNENMDKKDEAIARYKKVLSLLPDGSDKIKESINKMISNVESGKNNNSENVSQGSNSDAEAESKN